ncbi:uncharacterized protein DS421_3g80760 [Arachis hypogaea]|nr:uncharacterized protein DS421_3g80760 [Arachis hypogaea]
MYQKCYRIKQEKCIKSVSNGDGIPCIHYHEFSRHPSSSVIFLPCKAFSWVTPPAIAWFSCSVL